MDIKLVTWDVDGTLFSYKSLAAALIRLSPKRVRERGLVSLLKDMVQVSRFHRAVEGQRKATVVVEDELRRFAAIEAEQKDALSVALGTIRPADQVLEMLRHFQREGIIQVALSDFECGYKVEALGVASFFAKTYSCRSLGFWKPSPVPFDRVERDFGISPRQHLHIGDRLNADGLACVRTGCSFVQIQHVEAKMLGQVYANTDSAGLRRLERASRPDRSRSCPGETSVDVVPADRKHS